jgi:hypothetical protein
MPTVKYIGEKMLSPNQLRENTKERIVLYISEQPRGVKPHKIAGALKITRQYVHRLLLELIKERRVYTKNNSYFINDIALGNILNFARHMIVASRTLFDPYQIYFSQSSKATQTNPDIYVYNKVSLSFHKSIKGILEAHSSVISPEYCKTSFQDNEMYEKYLWELANRFGAYFVYIFIEAMRPASEYNIPGIKSDKKKKLSATLLEKSLDIKMMFERFCEYAQFDFANQDSELRNDSFNRITTAFKKVYPVVYESLERCWSDSINTSINTQAGLAMENEAFNHNHKWEEYSIYKLKNQKYFVCRGCGFLVNEKQKNRILVKGKEKSKP